MAAVERSSSVEFVTIAADTTKTSILIDKNLRLIFLRRCFPSQENG
jgi:hypothetical protein